MADIEADLQSSPAVIGIQGPPGVGKTFAALVAGARWEARDDKHHCHFAFADELDPDLFAQFCERKRKGRTLLIIDEAEKAPERVRLVLEQVDSDTDDSYVVLGYPLPEPVAWTRKRMVQLDVITLRSALRLANFEVPTDAELGEIVRQRCNLREVLNLAAAITGPVTDPEMILFRQHELTRKALDTAEWDCYRTLARTDLLQVPMEMPVDPEIGIPMSRLLASKRITRVANKVALDPVDYARSVVRFDLQTDQAAGASREMLERFFDPLRQLVTRCLAYRQYKGAIALLTRLHAYSTAQLSALLAVECGSADDKVLPRFINSTVFQSRLQYASEQLPASQWTLVVQLCDLLAGLPISNVMAAAFVRTHSREVTDLIGKSSADSWVDLDRMVSRSGSIECSGALTQRLRDDDFVSTISGISSGDGKSLSRRAWDLDQVGAVRIRKALGAAFAARLSKETRLWRRLTRLASKDAVVAAEALKCLPEERLTADLMRSPRRARQFASELRRGSKSQLKAFRDLLVAIARAREPTLTEQAKWESAYEVAGWYWVLCETHEERRFSKTRWGASVASLLARDTPAPALALLELVASSKRRPMWLSNSMVQALRGRLSTDVEHRFVIVQAVSRLDHAAARDFLLECLADESKWPESIGEFAWFLWSCYGTRALGPLVDLPQALQRARQVLERPDSWSTHGLGTLDLAGAYRKISGNEPPARLDNMRWAEVNTVIEGISPVVACWRMLELSHRQEPGSAPLWESMRRLFSELPSAFRRRWREMPRWSARLVVECVAAAIEGPQWSETDRTSFVIATFAKKDETVWDEDIPLRAAVAARWLGVDEAVALAEARRNEWLSIMMAIPERARSELLGSLMKVIPNVRERLFF